MTVAFILAALAVSAVDDLQSVLNEQRALQGVPGISAVVVQDDDVVFIGASGVADLTSGQTLTADSVFYIGSVSKVLTAVLVLQLVENGQLSLDSPISNLGRPESSPPITVAQLLSHASGLQREGDFGYWFTADFPDNAALLGYLTDSTLRSEPGTSLHYSNVGYAVLGQLVEQTTGKSFAEALEEGVLAPLGMAASGGRGPAASPAMGYTPRDRLLPSAPRPFAGVGQRVGRRHERAYHDARAMSPAFGSYASAADMGRMLRFLLGVGDDDVLSVAMRKAMTERQASGWGLGFKLREIDGRTVASHDGWFAAHRTHLLLDVENGVGVVVMANSDDASTGDIAGALLEAALSDD